MIKGNICRVEHCDILIQCNKSTLCNTHKYRWGKYKSFDDPTIKYPEGYIQLCNIHGYLKIEQVYIHKRGKYCRTCRSIKNKERKKIELDLSVTERKCGRCKIIKPLIDFSPMQNKQKWPTCRICRVTYNSVLSAKHKYHYKKLYNLTSDQYKEILKNQNERCKICNRTANEAQPGKITKRENNLSVDHCHKLEREGIIAIRGLLCFTCNTILGKVKDNPDILRSAIKYLESDPILITSR
jgi:hypothetical protein